MTKQKKETVWITIPDEATPALEAPVNLISDDSFNRVTNKTFWGIGFMALMIFSSMLLAPQEFAGLMQAQLFDGTFKVVPDYQDQGGTLFGEAQKDAEVAEGDKPFENETVVQAESEAVSIQVEPLTETDGQTSSEDVAITDEASADAAIAPENILVDVLVDPLHSAAETVDQGSLDANAQLLQSLSQQLEAFKNKEQENEQKIQDLMKLLEAQTSGVPTSENAQPSASFGAGSVGSANGVYRYNTHTVTVSPHQILAQNQSVVQQASYQANLAYQNVQSYSNQAYNPVLATVQGQPDTGPAESFLFALVLTSLGVLVWGAVRAARA